MQKCVASWETWPQATAALKNVAQGRTQSPLRNIQQRGKCKYCPYHLTCFPFLFSYLAKSWHPVVEEWKRSSNEGPCPQGHQPVDGLGGWAGSLNFLLLGRGIRVSRDDLKNIVVWYWQFFPEREVFLLLQHCLLLVVDTYLCFKISQQLGGAI